MLCKICNSTTTVLSDKKDRIFYSCRNCEFVFLDSNFYPSLEEEKKRYLSHNNSDKEYIFYLKNKIINELSIFLKNKKYLLDFGCGYIPILANLLSEMGFVVDFYDKIFFPSKKYLENKYDIILLIEVMEHIEDPLKELEELASLLKNGSIMFIKTLFHQNDERKFLNWWYKEDITHKSFYTVKTIKKIVTYLKGLSLIYQNHKDIVVLQKQII